MEGKSLSVAKAEEAAQCVVTFFRAVHKGVQDIEMAADITTAWVQAGMPQMQWWTDTHIVLAPEEYKP
jgi:hypothetical protein